jgi:hypothetical protein
MSPRIRFPLPLQSGWIDYHRGVGLPRADTPAARAAKRAWYCGAAHALSLIADAHSDNETLALMVEELDAFMEELQEGDES